MQPINKTKIKELRKAKGLNQEELGELLRQKLGKKGKIEAAEISRYERGETQSADSERIAAFAEIFDVKPEVIERGSGVKQLTPADLIDALMALDPDTRAEVLGYVKWELKKRSERGT